MISSGITGICSIFLILSYKFDYKMNYNTDDSEDTFDTHQIILNFLGAAGAGAFTTGGIVSFNKSLSHGSVEVASLFSNMRVIVQLVLELIIFSIIPSIASFLGVALALTGSTLMIFFQKKKDEKPKGDVKEVEILQ